MWRSIQRGCTPYPSPLSIRIRRVLTFDAWESRSRQQTFVRIHEILQRVSAEETAAWNVFNKSELEAWILLFQISYACLNKCPQVSRNVPIFETDRVTLTENVIKAAFSSFEHFPHLVSCWKVAWFNLNFLPPKKSSSCPVNYVKRTEIPTPRRRKIMERARIEFCYSPLWVGF